MHRVHHLLLAVLLLSGCAKHLGSSRSTEEWESRLETLVQERARTPSAALDRKIEKASEKVIEAHAKKASAALAQGKALDAGAHWYRAHEVCANGAAVETCEEIRASVVANQDALERAADDAGSRKKWEQASAAYATILAVIPDHAGVAAKHLAAQKSLASSLQTRANALEKKKLLGAAWAMNVRALEHDPMQPDAFKAGSSIERTMRSRAKVALTDVAVVAKKSDRAFANKIASGIRPRLDDVKPYGPSKDPASAKAALTMTVVKVVKKDTTASRVEKRAASGKKSGQSATWNLTVRDVTRVVEATVRFELRESDMKPPIVVEMTERLEKTDRTHGGSTKRKVAADPLRLPSSDTMLAEIAPRFLAGAGVIATARDRRVQTGLVAAKKALARGQSDRALHEYVEVMFLAGPEALPPDAAAFVAKAIERHTVETLLASSN